MKIAVLCLSLAVLAVRGAAADVPASDIRPLNVLSVTTNRMPHRMYYDFRMQEDLRRMDALRFELRCPDLEALGGALTVYFKSGAGWYSAAVHPEKEGEWETISLPRRNLTGVEGKPQGWREISCVRISGMKSTEAPVRMEVRGLACSGARPRVVIVCADSCARTAGAAAGFARYAGTLSATLERIGCPSAIVSDCDLEPAMLDGVCTVALPYNPSMPAEKAKIIAGFMARGGKLLACYHVPGTLAEAFGVRCCGIFQPAKTAGRPIAGFLRAPDALPGQPAFSEQASWIASRIQTNATTRVCAVWSAGDRTSLNEPAIVEVPNGIFIGHVWFGTTDNASRLLAAIVRRLDAGAEPYLARTEGEAAARARAQSDYVASVPPRADDFRGVWCHSPWGLGACHDWDSSVRFLKECGFTDLIVNLCWGGLAFYRSDVLPVSPLVATRGDQFELARAACRKYGIRMHVWKVCWRMNSACPKEYVEAMRKAGRTQVDVKGNRALEGAGWFCPSHPENQKVEIDTMLELAARGADGVHFDYIRYPGSESCYCDGCRSRFEAWCGTKVAAWPADVLKAGELRTKWLAFRVNNITTPVRTVAERLHGKSSVKISAAVFRNASKDRETVAQDWAAWCRAGWLDFVCPMDYTPSAVLHRAIVRRQAGVVGSVPLYPGIGLSCWPTDGQDARRLSEQISGLRTMGIRGFTVFNFDARAEAALPLLRTGPTRDVR